MPKPKKGESKQDFLKRCTGEVVAEGKGADQAYAMCNSYWDNANNQRSVMTLIRPVELAGKDDKGGKPRQFMITAYTGQPIQSWWGDFVIDINGIQTKNKLPVLREHKRDRVVGYGKAWKDESHLYIKGDFSEATKDADEVLNLADEGYPWQASVGVWPKKVEILESKKEKETVNGKEITGPAEIWRKSDVGEVSFVSLGADDDTAAISLTMSEGKVPVNIKYFGRNGRQIKSDEFNYGGKIMNIDELKQEYPELIQQIEKESFEKGKKEGVSEGYANGTNEERERVTEILSADADQIETKKAISDGTSSADCYKRFFEAEKERRAKGLTHLEAEATEPVGTETPAEPEVKNDETPDVKIQRLAQELSDEKGISIEKAQKEILAKDPELAKALREFWENPIKK